MKLFQHLFLFSCAVIFVTAGIGSANSSTVLDVRSASKQTSTGDVTKTIRLAQKKIFKYEVPKATRSAPSTSSSSSFTSRSTSRSVTRSVTPSAPIINNRGSTTTRRGTSTSRSIPLGGGGGGGGGLTVQVGPLGLSFGGGGGGGSCEGCRQSCYARLHGTKKFSPCMKGCWRKYCRR